NRTVTSAPSAEMVQNLLDVPSDNSNRRGAVDETGIVDAPFVGKRDRSASGQTPAKTGKRGTPRSDSSWQRNAIVAPMGGGPSRWASVSPAPTAKRTP